MMSALFSQLYRATISSSTALGLNQIELRTSRLAMHQWLFGASFGLLSILLALVLPDAWVPVAGYNYLAVFPLMPLLSSLDRRRMAKE